MELKKIELHISKDDEDVAYLSLPGHPGRGINNATAKQLRLADFLSYSGADVYFDLDSNGRLIGIEILA